MDPLDIIGEIGSYQRKQRRTIKSIARARARIEDTRYVLLKM
jgi:hypothetical protein